MTFASDQRAYGICDITGFRYRLRDMKKTWDGLLVGPDQWSPKEPQLMPTPAVADPQALRNPRPDPNADGNDNTLFTVYTNTGDGILGTLLEVFTVQSNVGEIQVQIT
jgi:hypothetical protein